jgi:transposase InsO family protein
MNSLSRPCRWLSNGRILAPGLVHHSDRGIEHAFADYTALLKDRQITISMGEKKSLRQRGVRIVSRKRSNTNK